VSVTLGKTNIILEMNSSARHMTETEEPNDRTNQIPRPESRVQFTLAHSSNQLVLSMPKIHTHVILTQLNKRWIEGLWK